MAGKLKVRKFLSLFAVIIFIALFAIMARAWSTGNFLWFVETHAPMTTRALELIDLSQYPDLARFSQDITDGSSGALNDEDFKNILMFGFIHLYPHGHESENLGFDYGELSQHKWEGTSYYRDASQRGILDCYKDKEFVGKENAYWFINWGQPPFRAPTYCFNCSLLLPIGINNII
jgi:hypothetical protein